MSDTDTTYALNGPAARPSALGDLRFAGTIATGLVAGTLGLGALAAPLVGWKDWPSGLEKDAATTPVRLATPKTQQPSGGTRENGPRDGGEQPGPGGATPLNVGLPGSGTGGAVPIVVINGPTSGASAGGAEDSAPTSTARTGTGSGSFTGPSFAVPDTRDDDGDQIPNDYERTVSGTSATNASDGAAVNANGVTNSTEFRIKANNPSWDTNGNGVVDAEDDSDGDGVANGVEQANGSDPALADTNGDGIPDGMEDWNNDGTPDSLPVTPAPVEEPEAEEPTVVETPAPPVEETPAPPVEEAPAPPAEETTPAPEAPAPEAPAPAPEAPAEEQAPETEPAPEPEAPAAAEEAPAQEEAPAPAPAEAAPAAEAPAPAPEAPAPAPAEAAPAPAPAEAPAAVPAEAAPAPAQAEQPAEDPAATPAW